MKPGGTCYLWKSNGGCATCDGMDGMVFEYVPGRPHPQCSCDITPINCNVDKGDGDEHEVINPIYRPGDYDYEVQHTGNDDSDPPNVTVEFDYTIQCQDAAGTSTSGSLAITMTRAELADVGIEIVASEVHDAVEQLAESLCSAAHDDEIIA